MLDVDDPIALAEEYAQLNADPSRFRRLTLAFGIAIVLVALVVGFVRYTPTQTNETAPPVAVALDRVPTPPPTPRPTPPPTPASTPPPRLSRVTPAPAPERAAWRALIPHGGGARATPQPLATPVAAPVVALAPSAPPAPAAVAPESGTGAGIGPGAGSGAGAGVGSGGGPGGSGTGAVNANATCGYVEFIPIAPPRYVGATAYERIRATVYFRDGHRESDVFPYPWVYPDGEQTDPWSQTNLRADPSAPVTAQLPPPGSNPARFSRLIRYILDHTSTTGHTLFTDCPPPA